MLLEAYANKVHVAVHVTGARCGTAVQVWDGCWRCTPTKHVWNRPRGQDRHVARHRPPPIRHASLVRHPSCPSPVLSVTVWPCPTGLARLHDCTTARLHDCTIARDLMHGIGCTGSDARGWMHEVGCRMCQNVPECARLPD